MTTTFCTADTLDWSSIGDLRLPTLSIIGKSWRPRLSIRWGLLFDLMCFDRCVNSLEQILGPRARKRDHMFAAGHLIDEVIDHIRRVRTEQFKYIRNYTPENGYRECACVRNYRPMLAEIMQLHAQGKLTEIQQLILTETKTHKELYDLRTDPHEFTIWLRTRDINKHSSSFNRCWTNGLRTQMTETLHKWNPETENIRTQFTSQT